MLGQGPVRILPWGLLKGAGIHFCCLFDGSHVSGICVLCCVVVGGLVVCVCVGGGGVRGVRGDRVVILVLNWVRAVFPCDYRSVVRQLVSQLVHVYN